MRRFVFHYEPNNMVQPLFYGNLSRNFGLGQNIMINMTGENMSEHLEYYQSFSELGLALRQGVDEKGKLFSEYKKVLLKPPESIPGSDSYKGYSKEEIPFEWLPDYKHDYDEDVLYIIGPDKYEVTVDMVGPDQLVAIPIIRQSLWSGAAAAAVAYDISVKERIDKKMTMGEYAKFYDAKRLDYMTTRNQTLEQQRLRKEFENMQKQIQMKNMLAQQQLEQQLKQQPAAAQHVPGTVFVPPVVK